MPSQNKARNPSRRSQKKPRVLGLELAEPRPLDPRLFGVKEHRLGNGLTLRLLEDRSVPAISYYTFFKVGSRNERPGRTGIAHLLEHMMFNGAAKYGPKEFDRVLESNGGHSNAFTSHDMTAYFEDFAAEALELVVDLESDRMRSLALAPEALASEREVVKEERRYAVENSVLGLLDENLQALAFQAHPYGWPIIGWMEDIAAISREDCLEFFRTYYAPNNATLWVVGDFDSGKALELIERSYADIPSGPPVPAAASTEPPQRGERRAEVRFPAHAQALAIGYKAPAGTSADAPVLDVLQYALSAGHGGRLVRSLVYERLLAANIFVDFTWHVDPGLFSLLAELNPGVKAERALRAIDEELERVVDKGLTETELRRAKGLLRSHLLREIASNNGRAHALGANELLLGDWRRALDLLRLYAEVRNDDVRRVAAEVLRRERRSVATLVPDLALAGGAHD
ncbi:MAG: M16 family metallopeptidase [Myxococcales bacterium]|jgi:zinc protease